MHTLLSECIKKLLNVMKTDVLLTDKTADETMTVIFGYVLPIVLAALFISVICYCVHKYIHVSKQKHPTNLVSVLYCGRSLPILTLTAGVCIFWGSESESHTSCNLASWK